MKDEWKRGIEKPMRSVIVKAGEVAEIQGLYGPITVSEKLLQKIWLRGDFRKEGLETADGMPLNILAPGIWNLQEGPDFKNAELEVGGDRLFGDVEVHFYMRDWFQHGHHEDTEFSRVVLHVVLFAPVRTDKLPVTAHGTSPHNLVLLPWLHQNIEEYANDEVLLALEERDQLDVVLPLLRSPLPERRKLLREKALMRWGQKVAYSRQRVECSGWEESCHQSAMEVLGYRRNRGPMITLATRHPLEEMAGGGAVAATYFEELKGHWRLAGLRPPNHPRKRLEQYLLMLERKPDWPGALIDACSGLRTRPSGFFETAVFRRETELRHFREYLNERVVGGAITGSRFDTLVCDAFLPLISARTGRDLFDIWFHWYGGDAPDALRKLLRQAELIDGRVCPASNGSFQGSLQYLMGSGM